MIVKNEEMKMMKKSEKEKKKKKSYSFFLSLFSLRVRQDPAGYRPDHQEPPNETFWHALSNAWDAWDAWDARDARDARVAL